ncbi:zinc-finger protease [Mycobacterium phage Saguaro]|uniref:Membrane protein n=1 Tax=Mycobacterium phage Saguaro TaxID=2315616 RepID=A0A386KA16_9CAUD|nr:zinc-finger protease [Mycobacterium phage Saguaro]AYD82075.1 membrane protein [Mycobacterium phage Saguaro]
MGGQGGTHNHHNHDRTTTMNRTIAALAATAALAGTALGIAPGAAASPTYDELFTWVDYLDDKYATGTIWVGVESLPPGTYAASRGNEIVFNALYVHNRDAFDLAMASDVAHGYHPGAHCTATQIVAAHEVAHVLDWATGYTARRELAVALATGLSGQVSGYSFDADGTVNIPEALANALVAVECDTPTPAESYIYNLLVN